MSQAAARPAGPPPLTGLNLALTAVAIAAGSFIQVLDTSIANVALPTIAGDLGVSYSQGTWVITSFAVANGVSVPLTGWLMGRYGVVKVFVASMVLFTIASFLCGIASSLPVLIAFRVLQGAVSGPLIPGSQALLITIFGPGQRGTALAIWSMTSLVAPICGPILGGYISDNFAWEWIFLINVPVGLACAFLCRRGLAGRETPTRKLPIDTVGFMLLLMWVGALQVMLDTGKEADWFNSPAIVVELLIAVVGFFAWVIWELTQKHPIVDLTLFRSRNFTFGTIVFCVSFAVFFGNNLLLPLWLQTQMGYVATWAGLVVAPSGLVAVLLTPPAARILGKIDARVAATFSLLGFALSFWMRSHYSPDADFFALAAPLAVQGVAMCSFFIAMVSISLDGVPERQVPSASGVTNFLRITAGSFAASVAGTAWDRSAAVHQTRLAETMASTDPAFVQNLDRLQGAGLSMPQAAGAVTGQVVNQAYLLSTLDFFRISAWLILLLIPPVWLTRKAVASGPAAAD